MGVSEWLNLTAFFGISDCSTWVLQKSEVVLTKDIPYLALMGELWDVFCEDFGKKNDQIIMALPCTCPCCDPISTACIKSQEKNINKQMLFLV